MADYVTAVCRTGYFWLRQLRSVVQSLTSEAADFLIHAFIVCRLDYCNAMPTAATAISPERSCASGDWNPAHRPHYAGSLQSLHWLPVRQRVTFKLATLVHKRLSGRAPGYLADDFRLAGRGRPGSRSAASMMLDITRTTTLLGDRVFAVAGPRVWNSLPPAIRL